MRTKEQIHQYNQNYYKKHRETIIKQNLEYARKRLAEDPETIHKAQRRDRFLQRTYGISAKEYDKLLLSQNEVCAICKEPPGKIRLCIDHNHVTGKIRKLLCSRCNFLVGYIENHLEKIPTVIQYLQDHHSLFANHE